MSEPLIDAYVSKHFRRSELTCRCGCGRVKIAQSLLVALEAVREHFEKPVFINCGTRCEKHNAEVGGEPDSRHIHGDAADIRIDGIPARVVTLFCDELIGDAGGVGSYETFTHIDTRGSRARWSGE